MMQPKPHNTAHIVPDLFCGTCGWPVIHACCNDGMANTEPYAGADYWGYCSNKTCEHHAGEAWWQEDPEFAVRQRQPTDTKEDR